MPRKLGSGTVLAAGVHIALSRRDAMRTGSALLWAATLAACGFEPLYGDQGAGSRPLALVQVDRIPERDGQVLRSLLEERLTPNGVPSNPSYSLAVLPTVVQTNLNVRQDSTIARFNLRVNARVALTPIGESRPIWSDQLRVITGYSDLADAFANRASEQAALERAYRQLAEMIRLRLSLFFDASGEAG